MSKENSNQGKTPETKRRPFEPNTTPTPNVIFDNVMADLPGDKFKVVLAVIRKTYGWHKFTDKISNSQIEKLTGLSKRTVQRYTAELAAAGILGKNLSSDGLNEFYFIAPEPETDGGGVTPDMGGCLASHGGDVWPDTGGMSGQTPTKETIKTNYQKNDAAASFAYYREVCDIFAKGFEKLEGSKLSWKGKEQAFGKAIKTIIGQAEDILGTRDATNLTFQEIDRRARALYRDIEQNRQARLRKGKHDEFIAKQKFTPLLLMNRWNSYPVARAQQSVQGSAGVPDPVATMSDAERAQHEALK